MIYINNPLVNEEDFVNLLEETKNYSLARFADGLKIIAGTDFQDFVYDNMCKMAKATLFEGTVEQTSTHGFPDIIAKKYFGVEVKMTISDHWVSTGNSVLETTRVTDVERIYMFFGKLGGQADIKYRPYQDCLCEVSVTHSPRYRIDMNLSTGQSIFDKMGTEYDLLRSESNPIGKIKNYYRSLLKEGEELWWIDADSDNKAVSPVIQSFNRLDASTKEIFLIESMILFPEIFSRSSLKFERVAAYLVTTYNSVSSNIRDHFTAGGQAEILIDGKHLTVPKVYYHLYKNARLIQKHIQKIDADHLTYYWRVPSIEINRVEQWKNFLDQQTLEAIGVNKTSDIFNAGLQYEEANT